ncbi:hypothetical protein [Psychroflexus salis]|uniref:Uncharacterized protein n=1 Tax=Psychroflexus salis TaxID=1526574 RepID=A0A916ZTJ5_9FLAO|nr:hypothetical protein [Psychroflexus salis]GGE12014.1 hypothetical protein GCM10010831_11820 [Psychroflexus salis]
MDNTITQCLESFLFSNNKSKDKQLSKIINCYSVGDKGRVILNTLMVANYLSELGFYQQKVGDKILFSLYYNGVLTTNISRDHIYSYLMKLIIKYDPNAKNKDSQVLNKLNIELNKHIKKETTIVSNLDVCMLKEYRDTKNTTRFFFKNLIVVVEVKNDMKNIKTENYNEFAKRKKYINSSKIIDFDYDPKNPQPEKSVYAEFVRKVTNESKHYLSVVTSIGFFLNSFKSKKDPVIFILSDENSQLKNDAYGQSGKSEILEAGLQFAVSSYFFENAQNFNKNFPFQNIRPEHDLFIFGDAPKDFNLKIMYEAKRGIDVEQKGRSKADFFIQFEYSPKILVDTNFRLGSNKSSDKGRIFRITINNYFDADYTPIEEFKHELFTDWDKTEWNNFYSFMIECAASYLKYGLVKYSNPKIESKILATSTSSKFVEYMSNSFELDKWYVLPYLAKEIIEKTYKESPVKASKVLLNWLQQYADDKGLNLTKRKGAQNKKSIKISKINLFTNRENQ